MLGTITALVVLLPHSSPPNRPRLTNEGPANLAATSASGRLTTADRRKIDATLDKFIPAAVLKKSAAIAWALAGPDLKSGSTLAQWQAGNTPVPYYPLTGTSFHDWTTIDLGPGYVDFNLLLHPTKGSRLAAYEFSGQMIRRGQRWLVNRWYTIAIMNPVRGSTHEIGPADFNAPAASDPPTGKPPLGHTWLYSIVGVLTLAILVPLLLGIGAFLRARRWRRTAAAEGRNQLPPLPFPHRVEKPQSRTPS